MELAPDDFEIAFTAAGYLREIGDNRKAEKCYKTAVQLNPEVCYDWAVTSNNHDTHPRRGH